MPILRPSSRPRASAELGYRLFAGLIAGGIVELLGVNLARDQNPQRPDYLTPSLVALGAGLLTAILDPPILDTRYGAWVSPTGEVIDVGNESHAMAALKITGPVDQETIDTVGGERCRGWGFPAACTAQVLLSQEGYVRFQHSWQEINIELFDALTAAQRAVLREAIRDKGEDADVLIDVVEPFSGRTIQSFHPPPIAGRAIRALDEASARAGQVEAA